MSRSGFCIINMLFCEGIHLDIKLAPPIYVFFANLVILMALYMPGLPDYYGVSPKMTNKCQKVIIWFRNLNNGNVGEGPIQSRKSITCKFDGSWTYLKIFTQFVGKEYRCRNACQLASVW